MDSPSITPTRAENAPLLSPRARILLLIIAGIVGLSLRLICLSCPPYDSHHFRQCQTLSTIEAYQADGIDLMHPRTIYMGYPGVFVLEVPLFQAVCAFLYKIFGAHWEIPRLLNICLGGASAWLLYQIARQYFSHDIATLSTIIYWLAPLNILFQRAFLLDPTAVLSGLASFYFLGRILNEERPPNLAEFLLFGIITVATALIKALYLWPAVLLFAVCFFRRGPRLDARMLRTISLFAFAGVLFVSWNRYAARVNNLSPISRGVQPTSLLGFDSLLKLGFYKEEILHRPKMWLGLSALFYPFGLWAGAKLLPNARKSIFGLFALIPPTYLILFANINYPHDYYQLIITPFLAVTAAFGAEWVARIIFSRFFPRIKKSAGIVAVASLIIIWSAPVYRVWLKHPILDPIALQFEKLASGKFEKGATGMLFVSTNASHAPAGTYIPGYQYAAGLWGYGRVIGAEDEAKAQYEEFSPGFTRMDCLVFYGTDRPKWPVEKKFHLTSEDSANQLFIFRRN